MPTIEIDLPFPPSVNTYWRSRICGKGSRAFVSVYVSPAGKKYQEAVKAAMWAKFGSIKPDERRMRVEIHATMPDRRKRDVDNLLKATLDALTAAKLWADDSQIDQLLIVRGEVKAPGSVRVVVSIDEKPKRPELFPDNF